MTGRSAVLVATVMAVAAIGTTADSGTVPRLVWNVSGSVPIGLYGVRAARDLAVATLVVAYPPEPLAAWLAERRYLPRGVPLLKPVLALEGQTVCRVGPAVDGREMGAARRQDHSGRRLPIWQGCHVINDSEVFLMNPDEPASLDGRYFGPIPIAAIAGLADPLWTSADDRSCGFDTRPMLVSSPGRPRSDCAAPS
jgi:conjugative transfer signal peptidase TraF